MPKELDVIPSAGRVRTVGELEEEDRDDADEKVIHDVCGWDKVISVRCTSPSSFSPFQVYARG